MDLFLQILYSRSSLRGEMAVRTARTFFFGFFTLLLFASLSFFPKITEAATFSLGPSSGSYPVGSTFDVQVFLDTQGKSVNAIELSLKYPADKLQLVSPSTGHSIIGVWTSQPYFNNAEGRLDL
jgi:hypothetical protein